MRNDMPARDSKIAVTDRRFNQIVVAAMGIGFLALVAAGVAAMLTIIQNEKHSFWVSHTYQVERQISQFRVLLERAEAGRRGLLLSGDPHILVTFNTSVVSIVPALEGVRRLTVDNPRQQQAVARIVPLVQRDIAWMKESATLVDTGRSAEAIAIFKATRSAGIVRAMRAEAEGMMAEENRLLDLRNRAQEASIRLFFTVITAAGLLLVAVGIGSIWVILRYTRDLAASRDQLQSLNANLEGAVRERTTDLQRANDEIQRFAYIVSHDLRSPLVNVMGFTAELETATKSLTRLIDRVEEAAPAALDAEAREAARVDLPEAIRFIRTSTQKMDRLINAILRLSREGRRPILPERVDMSQLARGVADSLKHRSDELGARIAIAPGLPAILSDRLAVEQILSNIVENALKYLQPGRPGEIEVAGRREGDRAVFQVKDNGRGIDPRDHDRVFDLFRRSGVQDQPGEGIGLAHTRALAYRLGGTISVQSRLSEGATFTVNLPVTFVNEQGSAT